MREEDGRTQERRDEVLELPARLATGAERHQSSSPAANAGRTMPAWFASVPYQGMRPEARGAQSSR